MKIGKILGLIAFFIIAVLIYQNKIKDKNLFPSVTVGAGNSVPPLQVSGFIIKGQDIADHIFTTGSVLANEQVELRNEISGRLIKINFQEGSRVNKGDLLVKIFDEDLQAQLRVLKLDVDIKEKSESREKDLLLVNGISQQEYDESLNLLNKARADMDLVKIQISKTEIHAPFSGTIGLRNVSEGTFLAPNTLIATIQEIDPVKLEFSIPERYQDKIRLNGEIKFTAESTVKQFTGRVYAFEPKIDMQTRTLEVRAICANPDHVLIPGSFAKVDIPLIEIKQALMVPTQSVIPEFKGQKVFISRNGKALPMVISIGVRNDTTVQATSGLQAGDTVLTTGIMQVRPDAPLKIKVIN